MEKPKITITFPVIGEEKSSLSCLCSIDKLKFPKEKIEIILVDNGFNSQLKREIIKKFPQVIFAGQGKNLGFAKAVNLALKRATGDWILVTNLDVTFDEECINNLLAAGLTDEAIGILGPKVYLEKEIDKLSSQDLPGFKTDLFWAETKSLKLSELEKITKALEVDWVSGSGMLIRKKVFETIGLFDERFFVYWEDSDFGLRAKKAGFKVVIVPSAKIYHRGSVVLGKETPIKIYYIVRNNLLFLNKHGRLFGRIRLHLRNMVLTAVKFLCIIIGIKRLENRAFLLGIFDFYREKFGQKDENCFYQGAESEQLGDAKLSSPSKKT